MSVGTKERYELADFDMNLALDSEPEPLDFVLPGLIKGTVGALVAPGGAGKSMWALQAGASIACSAASGADLLNLGITTPGRVLILAGEDPVESLHQRIAALKRYCTADQIAAVRENLVIKPCLGCGVDVLDRGWVDYIVRLATGSRLIVIDTLTRFHSGDENVTRDAKLTMLALENIAHRSGSALIFSHHVNKLSASTNAGDLQQAARGSSVFVDNARWAAFLIGMSEKEAIAAGIRTGDRRHYVRWNISKVNYTGPRGDQWYMRTDGGILIAKTLAETEIASKTSLRATKTKPHAKATY